MKVIVKQNVIIYRKIKKNITPTIKITNAPTIPPTVKVRFFDNLRDEPIGTVTTNKHILQVFHHLHYVNITYHLTYAII